MDHPVGRPEMRQQAAVNHCRWDQDRPTERVKDALVIEKSALRIKLEPDVREPRAADLGKVAQRQVIAALINEVFCNNVLARRRIEAGGLVKEGGGLLAIYRRTTVSCRGRSSAKWFRTALAVIALFLATGSPS